MLEVKARSGSGRILAWEHAGRTVETPTLIVPDTSLGVPDWAPVVLTAKPGHDAIEILSTGTWFYPSPATDGLVLKAPQPGPTDRPQVVFVGEGLAVFHDAGGWASDPGKFVRPFIDACQEATMGRALYAPALGTPSDYAVYAYLGVDLFDASPLLLAATRGEALTPDGTLTAEAAQAIHGDVAADLVAFNLETARQELARVREAIKAGRLRHLAERRALNRPDLVALLRRFDHEWNHLESRTPVHDTADVPCMSWDSLWMPEVERFRQRLRDDYVPPEADVLVLLPCSARKPYRLSKTHRHFQRALDDSGIRHRVHEVMITSPMGIVPRELEDTYPANRYDVPVTGHWNRDEEAVIRQQVEALLDKREYDHIIVHTDTKTWTFLRDLMPQAIHTAKGRPSSIEDCQRLKDALRAIRDALSEASSSSGTTRAAAPSETSSSSGTTGAAVEASSSGTTGAAAEASSSKTSTISSQASSNPLQTRDIFAGGKVRKVQDLRGLLSMQFGATVAQALTEGASARGRVPFVKLFGPDGQQYGQTTMDRGMLSLTLEGAAIVATHGRKRVFQGDFQIRKTGSLFAAGIEDADGDVRPGDDVVVMRGDQVTACGVAQMTADELKHMNRGVGVTLRHVVKEERPNAQPSKEVAA